ncbi:hypothetical protein NEMBOFW57_006210 [Staphylotrichum longicolle]|uniref:Ankyrin n=1 Tax=Staphylotrichum longicolle TaxID=669026 RepID=A0AAD4I2E4_9PEZI|nr:hypothetical protein NEMBOFW57_006210 [Staphylotrichum longicolle]
MLLEKGADTNAGGVLYGRALQAVSSRGYDKIAYMLLQFGADVNAQSGKVDVDVEDNEYDWTPLTRAAMNGHEAAVKLLLATSKADAKDGNSGQTPLSWAAEGGHEDVVKLLSFKM